ncbi:GNAT family N-acetyltransferase [Micromonospora sp. WMMD956]|uniref:GNAT family N-acetyltransferase n=1 Tax=Micromonospora sp. WMMD956 TaxID=3016108 RepID=UPI00241750FC|nr:GNAT family N-acetyltransferase [Micromonospora sp. WMMD956]MDG4818189.1 GNAT family N-acetyltransferase [Micromonospora sp. WMMD956]
MALWRIRATVDDRPGYLSVLTASLALRGVNILTVQVHTTEVGAVDDFLVDAPDTLDEAELIAAVERGRGRDCWVARSEARGLADQPTRVLGLATRLVRDPDAAGEALRTLLGADEVTWRPAAVAGGITGTTMTLPDPTGGSYELRRTAPSFTPAEYARAQALAELAATVGRREADQVTLVLPDGAEAVVRPATAGDLTAVVDLHRACSAGTLHRRYLGGAAQPAAARLGRLLEPAQGLTLVAAVADPAGAAVAGPGWPTSAPGGALDGFAGAVAGAGGAVDGFAGALDGSAGAVAGLGGAAGPGGAAVGSGGAAEPVVAMANLLVEGDEAEVALLVRDDWQRRGIGTALLRRLVRHAERAGLAALVLHVQAENTPMLRTVRRLARPTVTERDGTLVTVSLAVTGAPAGVVPAQLRRR